MDPIRIDHLPQAARLYGVKLYEQPAFTMPWNMHDFFEVARAVSVQFASGFPGEELLAAPQMRCIAELTEQAGRGLQLTGQLKMLTRGKI